MTRGTKTRDKVRYQCTEGLQDLYHAQKHFGQLAALADDRSKYIDEYLPPIMIMLDMVIGSVEKFAEGL